MEQQFIKTFEKCKTSISFDLHLSLLISLPVGPCSSALLVSSGRVCLALKVCWDVDSALQVDSALRKQRLVTILALN